MISRVSADDDGSAPGLRRSPLAWSDQKSATGAACAGDQRRPLVTSSRRRRSAIAVVSTAR